MKTSSTYRALGCALLLGLVAPATIVACSAETASHEEVDENENEAYETSLESAPEFSDADDSITRPTWAGNLSSGTSRSGQFAQNRKYLGFSVITPEAQKISIRLQTPIGSRGLAGHRLALYRANNSRQPQGRALAVGTSRDGGLSVDLSFENGSQTNLVLVAYRLSSGSTRGTFALSMSSEPAVRRCTEIDAPLTCGQGYFCKFEAGACDKPALVEPTGVCTAFPDGCREIYHPVCGCDGYTRENECTADVSGVSIAHEGECEAPSDKSCGPTVDNVCASNEYCDFSATGTCGGVGECKPSPQACTQDFAPVCGCDGLTYSNACHAASAGTSVVRRGTCR